MEKKKQREKKKVEAKTKTHTCLQRLRPGLGVIAADNQMPSLWTHGASVTTREASAKGGGRVLSQGVYGGSPPLAASVIPPNREAGGGRGRGGNDDDASARCG